MLMDGMVSLSMTRAGVPGFLAARYFRAMSPNVGSFCCVCCATAIAANPHTRVIANIFFICLPSCCCYSNTHCHPFSCAFHPGNHKVNPVDQPLSVVATGRLRLKTSPLGPLETSHEPP